MKKLSLLTLIFFTIPVYTQIHQEVFPKIGFADMYWLKTYPPAGWQGSNINYEDSSYYYPQLQELGLTHVVSYTDNIPLNPNYNTSTKILDNVAPKCPTYLQTYIRGSGNSIDHWPYETGGPLSYLNVRLDNYGFGTLEKSSWWIYLMREGNYIGDPNKEDIGGEYTYYAEVGNDQPGNFLRIKPTWVHFPSGGTFYLVIRARINGAPGNVPVATVYKSFAPIQQPLKTSNQELMPERDDDDPAPTTIWPWVIKADDFGGTNYVNLVASYTNPSSTSNPQEGTFTIHWEGNRSLYIDQIAIYSDTYNKLFVNVNQNVISGIKSELNTRYDPVVNEPLFSHIYEDEPFPLMYRSVGEISNYAESEIATGKYINGATLGLFNDEAMTANAQRRLPYVLYDLYTITENTSTSSGNFENSIQTAFDNLVNNSLTIPGLVERHCGLRTGIEWAQNFTPDELSDDVPFYHTMQVQGEKTLQNGVWLQTPDKLRFRAPTPNEILAEGNLALCYGAKGIMYFLIMTATPNSAYEQVGFYGLFEEENNLNGIIQNPANNQIRNERYWAVKRLNEHIDRISPELLQLTWKNGYSIHKGEFPVNGYITNIQYPPNYTPDCNQESNCNYIELGLFKKTEDFTDNNLDYFYLVNRRTLPTEVVPIRVTLNKSLTNPNNYTNWGIKEIGTTTNWTIPITGMIEPVFQPGEGKLFSLRPVVLGGGVLKYNENINGTTTLDDDLIIDNNAVLTIAGIYNAYADIIIHNGTVAYSPNGKINFYNGAKLIIEGVTTLQGTPSSKFELNFMGPQNNSGIVIRPGGNLYISYCKIINAAIGIQADLNFARLFAENCEFTDCGSYSIALFGLEGQEGASTPPVSQILSCTITGSATGVFASTLSELVIKQNQITNTDLGISLIGIANPLVANNTIISTQNSEAGISLLSCSGTVRGNWVQGHTNGIYLGNSFPLIGGNTLYDNLYHGMYIGSGSLPNMQARLMGHPPVYYAISGYNHINENGGWAVPGPDDNDGSEIYFSFSNADMVKGCNQIEDIREPNGELQVPLETTINLMNGTGETEIKVNAELNYWGEPHPLYHLEERFGALIVDFDPYNSEPCEIPQGMDEYVIKSASGEAIDTVQASGTAGNPTNTELLYSSADGDFATAELDNAELKYKEIISGNDSLEIKLSAYRRLYEIGRLKQKPSAYFDSLYILYSSVAPDDTLMQKIFTQLGSLSLIGETEYLEAINEFDQVVQNNPNTEEAVYAEIDAMTTALLLENDSTINKTTAGKYIKKTQNEYLSSLDKLLRTNFGNNPKPPDIVIPEAYLLYQNYPNPFNPSTKIKYSVAEESHISLTIYNILGQEVAKLKDEVQKPGYYEVNFDASSLSSGIYLYTLETPKFTSTKKMMVLK